MIDNLLHRFGFSKLNYFGTKKVYPKTEIANFHMNTRKPVVLVAPLDWGLGHTIRCIPIIKELLENDCEVIVACNPKQKKVLSPEFPVLGFVHLSGYDISYGGSRLSTILKLIGQTPKILMAVKREHSWLSAFLAKNLVDIVISDNRYGLSSPLVQSVFITHQLRVKTGLGKAIDNAVQKKLYSLINKFSLCWVPDSPELIMNAGGGLSHPRQLPGTPVTYIGCLSRLHKCSEQVIKNDLVIILSGPEPQRTILEAILVRELKTFQGTALIVRGLQDPEPLSSFDKISIVNYASASELNKLICTAGIIICRAGYTSVMDMLKLGKKSILIPTPGQAEQEYLAKHLEKNKLAVITQQEGFRLQAAVEAANGTVLNAFGDSGDTYKTAVRLLVASVREKKNIQSASADFGKSKK